MQNETRWQLLTVLLVAYILLSGLLRRWWQHKCLQRTVTAKYWLMKSIILNKSLAAKHGQSQDIEQVNILIRNIKESNIFQ